MIGNGFYGANGLENSSLDTHGLMRWTEHIWHSIAVVELDGSCAIERGLKRWMYKSMCTL